MFEDEARFGRIQDPKRCWAPPHVRPQVGCQRIREYCYVYAAASPLDGQADLIILPFLNADLMSLFLKEVSRRHPHEAILMFMDGASSHQETSLVFPHNIITQTIPPYCPELNPVEHIWDDIRENFFSNVAFKNLDAVEDQLGKAILLLERQPLLVRSITGFKWILRALKRVNT